MPLRGQARRGVSFLSSKFAVDINQNVAPPSPSGGGEHALRKVSSLSSSCALDLQARSLVKNVKRGGLRRPSRMPLAACATRWFPGRGRLLAGPRSAGTFYSSKVKASLAWWADSARSTPLAVLRWISQGVKVEFSREFRPLSLAPREVHPSEIPFILADQDKGRRAGAYVDLAPGGSSFLSRSRVHTTAAGKSRMVHALCALNEVTVKRPTRCEGVADLPKLLRPGDYLLSADVEAAFWHVPIHASSRKFFSSHFAMPAEYIVDGSLRRTPLLPGGYWAWQPAGPAPRVSSSWRSSVDSLPPLRAESSAPLLAPLPETQSLPLHPPPHTGRWLQIVEFSHAALPFGWTSSPRIWEAVCRVLAAALRQVGIRVLIYVDDFLLALRCKSEAYYARTLIQAAFTASGITRAPAKGQWIPGHVLFDHLGFHISTLGSGLLKVPERRCRILRALARDLLRTAALERRQVCSDKLRVFTGTAVSCSAAIPQARLRLRSLFDAQEEYRLRSVLQRAQLRDLAWWADLQFDSPANGCLFWPPAASVSMWTDASGSTGFGSVLEVPSQARRTHGSFWRKEDIPLPICVKELKAVKLGLIEHADALRGRTVRLFQDNQAVVGAMRAFSSSSPAMMVELREIWALLDSNQIRFTIEYIRSELNPADAPSRLCSPDLWSLCPRMRCQLLHRLRHRLSRSVSLDPFACRVSAVVPRYATPLYDSKALAMDGLLLDWAHECLWLCPPWRLLLDVVDKLQRHGCGGGILIYPAWPLQPWWEQLSSLPGLHFRLPPARFVVVPHHSSRHKVEPLLNHCVTLRAVIMPAFCGDPPSAEPGFSGVCPP